MLFALVIMGILSLLSQTQTVGYFVLAFAGLYIIAFAYSWGPVVWSVCAEIFPYRTREKSTGLTTMTNWLATTVVGAIFPIASSASLSACFFFFAGAITIGTTIVYFFQVETASKTMSQIDEAYNKHTPKLFRTDW